MRFHGAGSCGRGGPGGSSKHDTSHLRDYSAHGSSTSSVAKASQFCLARLRCNCLPAYSVAEGMDVCRAATVEELAELPAADELQQGTIAVLPILPEPGRPIILPLFAQAGLTRGGAHPSASLCCEHTIVSGLDFCLVILPHGTRSPSRCLMQTVWCYLLWKLQC